MAYSPQRRECRLSGFDQRDSRILYDPLFDYYENLVTGVPPPLGESANFSALQSGLIDEIFFPGKSVLATPLPLSPIFAFLRDV